MTLNTVNRPVQPQQLIIFLEKNDETQLQQTAPYDIASYEDLHEAVLWELKNIDVVTMLGTKVESFRVIIYTTEWKPIHSTTFWSVAEMERRMFNNHHEETWEELCEQFAKAVDVVARAAQILKPVEGE